MTSLILFDVWFDGCGPTCQNLKTQNRKTFCDSLAQSLRCRSHPMRTDNFIHNSFDSRVFSVYSFFIKVRPQTPGLNVHVELFFVLRKTKNKTKKRMKEGEIEKGDCGPPTRKDFF